MEISLVCPIYKNNPEYLKKALDSFCVQVGNFEKELIVVVDPPAGESKLVLDQYEGKNNIRVIYNEERKGLVASRKAGIEASKGKYIGFLDGDDYLSMTFCRKMVETLRYSGADIVDCSFYRVDAKKKAKGDKLRFTNGVFTGTKACELALMDVSLRGFFWSKVYKREILIKAMKDIDVSKEFGILFEDFPVNYAAMSQAKKVVLIKDKLYYYRKAGEGSATDTVRADRPAQHLTSFALARHYADLLENEELVRQFRKKILRIKTSIWFDISLSKKAGLSKEEIRKIKYQTNLLAKDDVLQKAGMIWSDVMNRAFTR